MLWLPSFGLFLLSSVKLILTKKVIIKKKKEKYVCMCIQKILGGSLQLEEFLASRGLENPYFQNSKIKKLKI